MNLRAHRWVGGALVAAMTALTGGQLAAQTSMPSTLRHGSGYLDNPAASALPHMAFQATYSGFWVNLDQTVVTDAQGNATGYGPGVDQFYGDASLSLGLFDRAEIGASVQSLNDETAGGNLFGVYGRVQLLRPTDQGLGVAVGARYNNSPEYANGEPNRLGYPDQRFTSGIYGSPDTNLSLYVVGTSFIRGFEVDWFPQNDITLTGGYGTGMFQEGGEPENEFYRYTDTGGLFGAASWNIMLGDNAGLQVITEWNGWEANVGAQVDMGGLRIGAHMLNAFNDVDQTTYRSRKFGLLASVGLCGGGLCGPQFIERPEPEVIQLPAPAPDTVVVTREVAPAPPTGNPTNICLATGQDVRVLLTAQGDTLVGEDRVSIRTLRPGVVFAGTYADGRDWYTNDSDVRYENRNYSKSGNPVSLECANIMRVGEHMGVPLFANRSAERPFETLYVPVRPGQWQAYQTLRGTRGD